MQNEMFEFLADNSLTGYRLDRFELFNWGTFDKKIWKIEPNGFNSLLTGDIGSGKSTIVDAITTLLIQQKRITYNKAAGAEGKERTLYQYIRGAYGNLKGEESGSKVQYLRDKSSYSVLLGSFYNAGYDKRYTIAQVFWLKDDSVDKFFLIGDSDLKIKEHLTGFGTEISELKKKLKKISGIEILDSYKEYSSKFRNYFGIRSDKALDLFYHTVSLKSINNLNEFIRENMLEKYIDETYSEIEDLKNHFMDLNLSHEAILKAKYQIKELTPVIEKSEEHGSIQAEIKEFWNLRDSLPSYFAEKRIHFYKQEIEKKTTEKKEILYRIEETQKEIRELREEEKSINWQLGSLDEVREKERLESQKRSLEQTKEGKKKNADRYNQFAEKLNLSLFPDLEEKDFFKNQEKVKKLFPEYSQNLTNLEEEIFQFKKKYNENEESIRTIAREIESLRERKSLIPNENLRIREILASGLQISSEEIPFAGELLRVTDKKWEGAIEKVLHGFALSILVPEKLYKNFSRFVNENSLRGRLVYYKISTVKRKKEFQSIQSPLFDKIEIKVDTDFYDWLETEIKDNYNYSCADSIEDFQKQQKAITKEGQIKFNQSRHEKDDRKKINDKSNYVLGWNNKEKISSLQKDMDGLEIENKDTKQKLTYAENGKERVRQNLNCMERILELENFYELNWKEESNQIEAVKKRLSELSNSSDKLKILTQNLENCKQKIEEKEKLKSQEDRKLGSVEEILSDRKKKILDNENALISIPEDLKAIYFPKLDTRVLWDAVDIGSLEKENTRLLQEIEKDLEKSNLSIRRIREKLVSLMANFRNRFPKETVDFDANIDSIPEFQKLFTKLKEEDLPRFEEEFKKKLNKEIIVKIAHFKEFLENKANEIKTKVHEINKSLHDIEYNKGTYILLNLDRTNDEEISLFIASLKNCLTGSIGNSEFYDEERFQKVKTIIDRLSSGEESEKRWREKVVDVTNWFQFSATEKYISDDSEKESYSGASGKSGGQKEKLAYTVLASALAYQFGLEWKETRSNTFRFVVIDEAFGRGSDESTRYGLELFKKLNLQLLIVTPLQKIHVIEEYIKACHLVVNKEGKDSSVKNLSIEEYYIEKEKVLHS